MAQTKTIFTALKQALKLHDLTYSEVAEKIDISESSVKRMFSEQNISLRRLDSICAMMNMEISDLLELVEDRRQDYISELNYEQEKELAVNPQLLLICICVLNHWSYQDILNTYTFSEPELIQLLAKLDRLKLIELLPKNRFKLLVSRNFSWLKNGPIQRFFESEVQARFFNCKFNGVGELRVVLNGMLSPGSNELMCRKIHKLAQEFEEINNEDSKLPIGERSGTTVVFAIRPWEFDAFRPYRRPESL